jgi:hypothetical protein
LKVEHPSQNRKVMLPRLSPPLSRTMNLSLPLPLLMRTLDRVTMRSRIMKKP